MFTGEQILSLVKAGFTAEEIRRWTGEPAPEPVRLPASEEPAPSDPEPAAAPEEPAPEEPAAPDEPAAPAAPKEEPNRTPEWFAAFVKKNNEDLAALQRALQVQNVRRAEPGADVKTPEEIMADAYRAIIE